MKKKNIYYSILLIAFCFSVTIVKSQSVICGYDLAVENLKKSPEVYRSAIDVYKSALEQQSVKRDYEDVEIPITFHIVWNDTIENIHDSLIYQQVEVLNESFRRTNENKDEVRSEFAEIVGDAHIQFTIADIVRVKTDTVFEIDLLSDGLFDYVKSSADGGSDAADVETSLNIWICNIQPISFGGEVLGVLLGYAYPPSGLDHWPEEADVPQESYEGVVLDYKIIGRNNPNIVSIPNLVDTLKSSGLTAVHEVGHYLGLRHTWADANGFLGEDGCLVDDGVSDTPLCSTESSFDCNYQKNTCDDSTTGVDLPDMVENFMDYSSEDCMNSFTNGQIGIMRSVLRNSRCKLIGDCSQVGVKENNIFEEKFTIAPNPTSDQLFLSFTDERTEVNNVTIYNNAGITMKTINTDFMDPIYIDYASGLYFIQVNTPNGPYVSKFVVE